MTKSEQIDADPGSALLSDLERFKPDGMTLNAWAVCAGVSRAVWGDIRRHGNPSRRTLERLLVAAGSSLAEFEALRVGTLLAPFPDDSGLRELGKWRSLPPLPPIPVLAAIPAERMHIGQHEVELFRLGQETAQRADRPSSMAQDRRLFAFANPVSSMWPRFRKHRLLIVAPERRCCAGDDVIVTLAGGNADQARSAFLAELIEAGETELVLRQFQPAVVLRICRSTVRNVDRVMGEAL